MSTLQIVGLAFALYGVGRYVQLWVSLITAREHRPQIRASFVLPMMLAGTIGASMILWELIPWWMVPVLYLGTVVLVLIPVALFRAR